MKTMILLIIIITIATFAVWYSYTFYTASQNWGGGVECDWFGCYATSAYGPRCEDLFDDIYEEFLETDESISLLDYVHEHSIFIEWCANTMQNWAPHSQYHDAILETFKFQ